MRTYNNVSRKTVREDRIAICPKFGCELLKRVKPLKFGFLGFGKYPKCKKHHVPLVYIDERIGDFVDGALACLFDKAGLKPKHVQSTDDLVHVPTTEKKDLRELYPFPVLGFKPQEVYRFAATTGTTGTPVNIGFTRKDWFETLRDQMGRQFFMWGVSSGDIVYQGYGLGLWLGGPGMELGTEAAGATLFPAGPGRSHAAVEWIKDIGITVLLCSPSYCLHLIRTAKTKGIDPKNDWKIRVIMFGGEKASKELRKKVENEMPEGAKIFANYGLTESGGPNVASECVHTREHGEMHILADHLFPEIIDSEFSQPLAAEAPILI